MIADGPLGVGSTGFKRHLVHTGHLGRDLGPAQDEAHLGTVTMANGHVPALFDHVGDVIAGLLGGQVLVLHSDLGLVLDERVAADGDDGEFPGHRCTPFLT